ncbi:MAG: hypothetical protein IH958_04165 [Chloroflexi bacterium]|nr:hypothetical protein [Chloroflexota bacterium]
MRITSIALAAALLGAAALAGVHAQEPTGSISGRIVFVGEQPVYIPFDLNVPFLMFVIPADIEQPLDFNVRVIFLLDHVVAADEDGNFTATGLEDGDYFIIPTGTLENSRPPPETIAVDEGEGPTTRLVVRVTVAAGQAVSGVELFVVAAASSPEPDGDGCRNLSPPNGLSPFAGICPPTTGGGGTTTSAGGAALAYLGLAVAGLAVAMFAGGLALRARTA